MQTRNPKILLSSLIFNVVLLLLLIAIAMWKNYPQKIAKKFSSQKVINNVDYHHINAQKIFNIYEGGKNIVMLGTSLTEGVNWNELLQRADVAGRGISGDTTGGFILRFDEVLRCQPKICFIEGGINDLLIYNLPQDQILKNMTILIDTLQKNDIQPVISAVTFVAEFEKDADKLNRKITGLNTEIYQLATSKNIPLIDLNKRISDGKYLKAEYAKGINDNGAKDGVHFSPAAYLIWKEEVEKIVINK